MAKRFLVYAGGTLLAVAAVWAQTPATNVARGAVDDAAAYSQLTYRYIGPPGNRTDAVMGVAGDPWTYYAGAASGGIFKTTDGGVHWSPIFDSQPVASIGSLAVAPSDPNVVWAGTGESFIRSHISIGEGIFKSTDSGRTWKATGLEKAGRIGRVLVHPTNPEIVFACALGTGYGPQPDRGVFRSTDGGEHWDKVLFVDENTGCSDLAMDVGNPRILYAGTWQLIIHTWGRTSGGPGSGVYKSTDGGSTWTHLMGRGLPHAPLGKIGLSVARSDPNRVYALIETGDGVPMNGEPTQLGQLWSSSNGGDSWEMVSTNRDLRSRTHYYTRDAVSPGNENELYFLGNNFTHSLDGGRTLTPLGASPGGDNHDMWIDPVNADRMIVANDSGVSISVDHGRLWNHVELPIAQIYHVTVDDQIPYKVYGNKQDGGSYSGPSRTAAEGRGGGGGGGAAAAAAAAVPAGPAGTPTGAGAAAGRGAAGRGAGGRGGAPAAVGGAAAAGGGRGGNLPRGLWHAVGGSESGFATPDPVDPNIVWSSGTGSGSVGGVVTVFDERNGQARNVEVWPETTVGAPAEAAKYRFNWEFPITISPFDHNKVYVGSQFVHVTTDGGASWQVISPDLTRNDKSKQGISGGLTPDNIGVEYAGVVFSIAESPKQAGVIWAGTNDGYVQLTRDGGKTWTNLTKNIPGLPEWGTVDNIEASRFNVATAYLTVDLHQMDNRDPWVYKTADFGQTWTKITDGLPHTMLSYAHCIREDPARAGLLFLGTEGGLFVSFDDGARWQPLQNNLPHAPVYWLAIQNRFHDLAVATYGRGFWILDDISPLEQPAGRNAVLLPPRDAYRFRGAIQPAAESYDPTAGQNAAYGADLNYVLPQAAAGAVRITIADAAGHTVRVLAGTGQAGLNRIYWDLRGDPGTTPVHLRTLSPFAPDLTLNAEGWRPAPGVQTVSLLQPPGKYTVSLAVGGQTYTETLTVLKDPHSHGTEADIQTQLKLAQTVQTEIDTVARDLNRIELIRAQLATLSQALADDAANGKPLRDAAAALDEKLFTFESNLYQVKATGRGEDEWRWAPALIAKLQYLEGELTGSDFPPTTQQVEVNQGLAQQVTGARAQLDKLIKEDVAALNAQLRQHNISNIYVIGGGGER
jgi:hypothetical protein